jgi:hypothetical protein
MWRRRRTSRDRCLASTPLLSLGHQFAVKNAKGLVDYSISRSPLDFWPKTTAIEPSGAVPALARTGLITRDYAELWRWSVEDIDRFWQSIWSFFDVQADGSREPALGRGCTGTQRVRSKRNAALFGVSNASSFGRTRR